MSNITIAPGKTGDAKQIYEVRDASWLSTYVNDALGITKEAIRIRTEGPNGEFTPRKIAYLDKQLTNEDSATSITLVAKDNGKIIGYIAARYRDDRPMISMMYILDVYHNQGIGSKLMNEVLECWKDKPEIFLEVVDYNDNAIKFYKKFGFIDTGNPVEDDPDAPDYFVHIPQIEMVRRKPSQ